jgi:hypothetical protein
LSHKWYHHAWSYDLNSSALTSTLTSGIIMKRVS